MEIQVVTRKVWTYLRERELEKKWRKACAYFEKDIRHPSLHTELLEPREEMIFSFRVDRKYRALFVIKEDKALVFRVTNHYKK